MSLTIYYAFALLGIVSAVAALCVGAYRWRSLQSGLRVLVLLLFVGVAIDLFGLTCLILQIRVSRNWLHFNHFMQFASVVIAMLLLGKDVIAPRMYWLLTASLYGYVVASLAVFLFAPQWFAMPYHTPLTYLLLLYCICETALQYHRTSLLVSHNPETYVVFGFMFYAAGMVVIFAARLLLPDLGSSPVYVAHGVLALGKNVFLLRAFNFAWKRKQSISSSARS